MKLPNLNFSSDGRLVLRNVSWSVIEKITNMLSALSVGILVARYLGDEQYGLLNYVSSYISLFLIFACFGFDYIEIREEARRPEKRDVIMGTVACLRMMLSVIAVLAIGVAMQFTETSAYTKLLLGIASLSIPISVFNVIRNHFTSILRNEYVSKVGIICVCVSCAIKILLMCLHAPLLWFVTVLVFSDFLTALGFYVAYARKVGNIRAWSFDVSEARYFLTQSFPMLLSAAAAIILLRIDQVMIGQMIGNAQLGQFSVAIRIVEILVFLPTVVMQTISPLLVKMRRDDENLYRKRSQMVLNFTVWTCALISVCISLLSEYIVKIPFGEAYADAVLPLRILAFKTIGVALNVVAAQLLVIEGLQKYFVLRSLSGCVVCIVLNYYFIPLYGIVGVSVIACVTQLISGWLVHIFIPMYRPMFCMQSRAVFLGWIDMSRVIVEKCRSVFK